MPRDFLDVRLLRYFLAIAQAGSITRAAQVLHTTQPNLSRQIADLERACGKQLLVRRPRSVELTEEGLLLRERAREVLSLVERTEADLARADDTAGEVRIGAPEAASMRTVGDILRALRDEHPLMRFDIFSGSTREVCDLLDKGLLDFGILVEPAEIGRYDFVRLPVRERFGVLMADTDPLAAKEAVAPEDVRARPLFLAHQIDESNALAGWLGCPLEELDVVATFNLVTTTAMLVAKGMGCAFTFDGLVACGPDTGLAFRLLEPPVETGLIMVWRKQGRLTHAQRVFLERVQTDFASHPSA